MSSIERLSKSWHSYTNKVLKSNWPASYTIYQWQTRIEKKFTMANFLFPRTMTNVYRETSVTSERAVDKIFVDCEQYSHISFLQSASQLFVMWNICVKNCILSHATSPVYVDQINPSKLRWLTHFVHSFSFFFKKNPIHDLSIGLRRVQLSPTPWIKVSENWQGPACSAFSGFSLFLPSCSVVNTQFMPPLLKTGRCSVSEKPWMRTEKELWAIFNCK